MSETPYRTPQPPCPECEARKDAAKKMLSFIESGKRQCPECLSQAHVMWQKVCRGSGSLFLVEKGYWFFGWRKRITFECVIKNAPKHFHFACSKCNHRWMMLTATESPKEESSDGG